MKNIIEKFCVPSSLQLQIALEQLQGTHIKTLCVLDTSQKVLGMLSDADVRNFIISQTNIAVNDVDCGAVMNRCFASARNRQEANKLLNDSIKLVPVIDDNGMVLDLVFEGKDLFFVGQKQVGRNSPTFIISEIGVNHDGDLDLAKKLIDKSKSAGADAVKFQMRDIKSLYGKYYLDNPEKLDLGSQYQLEHLERLNLSVSEHEELRDYCRKAEILYICTPFDRRSVEVLKGFELDAAKVSSSDFLNEPLIDSISHLRVPTILSTGMVSQAEIHEMVSKLKSKVIDFALLHCNSTYPTPYFDINLSFLKILKSMHPIIGYSGHERGVHASIAACALGADIIERHITLDKTSNGPDHAASLEPNEFREMVIGVRQVEEAMGDDTNRMVTQGELLNREVLGKSIVASRDLKIGTIIEKEHLDYKSPGNGLSPVEINRLIGKTLNSNLNEGEIIFETFVGDDRQNSFNFKIPFDWGVPVRLHDVARLIQKFDPPVLEFHPSYSDLKLDPKEFFSSEEKSCVVFHCPEMIDRDQLLNLASLDETVRNHSVSWFRDFLINCRSVLKVVASEAEPKVVINVGGFSVNEPLGADDVKRSIDALKKSFGALTDNDFELLPQTMPPFPWHFGGQRFHNLFVCPDQIEEISVLIDLKVCLDTSHTLLACNHLGFDANATMRRLLPISSHIHVGDAGGEAREGLQLGEGDFDLSRFFQTLVESAWQGTLIPEIWQGHTNDGAGFEAALKIIEAHCEKY